MTIATVLGLFIIPVCYVFVGRIIEKPKKHTPATPETGTAPAEGGH